MKYIIKKLALVCYWFCLMAVCDFVAKLIFPSGLKYQCLSLAFSMWIIFHLISIHEDWFGEDDKGIIRTLREGAFRREKQVKERLNEQAP